jgi:hypothetical protein
MVNPCLQVTEKPPKTSGRSGFKATTNNILQNGHRNQEVKLIQKWKKSNTLKTQKIFLFTNDDDMDIFWSTKMTTPSYVAMVCADWNECLAPCGPFDALVFHHPDLETPIDRIFRQYTGNIIPLGRATERIASLLPGGISPEQMDAYLEHAFKTYTGVAGLIRWCRRHRILFMINTTGAIGYFQRIWAKNLLPCAPVLSAHPMLRYPGQTHDPSRPAVQIMPLRETQDKPRHTAAVAAQWQIPYRRLILMGDSGGDGPHFEWGAAQGACLIGCMTKPSLSDYCSQRSISIDHHFGRTYEPGQPRDTHSEMNYDYMQITRIINQVIN